MSYRVPSHVLAAQVGDETVLLDLRSEHYYSLDDVGSRMWALLVECGEIECAIAGLLREYDVPEDELRRDVEDLVRELVAQGLLAVDAA